MCVWRQFSERQVEDASLGNGRKWESEASYTTFIRPFVWINLKEFETKQRDTRPVSLGSEYNVHWANVDVALRESAQEHA